MIEGARARAGALRVAVSALVLALAAAPEPAGARELWSRGDASLEVSGSIRELAVGSRATDQDDFLAAAVTDPATCANAFTFADCPAFGEVDEEDVFQSLTRLRTRFDARASKALSMTVVYDHELLAGRLDTFERSGLRDVFEGNTYWDLDHDFHDGDHVRWTHLLHRAYVRVETPRVDLRIGRQRIAWGVGRRWAPMDRFSEIPPLAIERDQYPGVDAVDARWNFSGFTFLEAVYEPAHETKDSSGALRFHGVARQLDFSIMAGIFEEARVGGFDLAGNLLDAAVRLEVVFTDPERDTWPIGKPEPSELSPFVQAVASVDYNFDVGNGLYVLVEHLYNGNNLGFGRGRAGRALSFFESTDVPPDPLLAPFGPPYPTTASSDVLGTSLVVSGAIHQTGLQLSYELTPALRGDFLTILDWNGESAAFAPTLSYTGFGAVDLTLGAQLFAGPRLSEYGDLKPVAFLYFEFFF